MARGPRRALGMLVPVTSDLKGGQLQNVPVAVQGTPGEEDASHGSQAPLPRP